MRTLLTLLAFVLLAVAAAADPATYGAADFLPSPQRPVGWRGDGTGCFPGATPPAAWDLTSGKGVLWATELPRGNSSPIVVGDKVFVTSDPNLLICLDAPSGKELWRAEPSVFAAMGARGKGGDEAFAECWRVRQETKQYAYNAVPKDLAARTKGLWAKLEKTYGVRAPGDHGYANATPVSDGQAVYAKFGTGVVAKYDLAGHALWSAVVLPRHSGSSPVLIGDRLVIVKASAKTRGAMTAVALNPADGTVVWEADGLTNVRDLGESVSPVGMTLGNAALVVMPGGEVLHARDGKLLGRAVTTISRASSPVVHGDTVYFVGNPDHGHGDCAMTAVQLALTDPNTLAMKELWRTADRGGKETLSSPLYYDGYVYLICTGDPGLYVYDAATGQQVAAKSNIACRVTTHNFFPSPALAGTTIVASIGDGPVHLVKPGADWSLTATVAGATETAASPFFQGSHVYIRDAKRVYCAGAK